MLSTAQTKLVPRHFTAPTVLTNMHRKSSNLRWLSCNSAMCRRMLRADRIMWHQTAPHATWQQQVVPAAAVKLNVMLLQSSANPEGTRALGCLSRKTFQRCKRTVVA